MWRRALTKLGAWLIATGCRLMEWADPIPLDPDIDARILAGVMDELGFFAPDDLTDGLVGCNQHKVD